MAAVDRAAICLVLSAVVWSALNTASWAAVRPPICPVDITCNCSGASAVIWLVRKARTSVALRASNWSEDRPAMFWVAITAIWPVVSDEI